tara:strand:+ start:708 stop:1130 length:423 start_codon:yes stop_codon:yes gene_type:complete
MIEILEVDKKNDSHINILFSLLNKRQYSISHSAPVSIDDHIQFVKNHPYRNWFLIYKENKAIGSCYLTYQNTLGINLVIDNVEFYKLSIEKITALLSPLEPIPSLRNKKFTVNISPNNISLEKALIELGSKKIQITYLLK